jgi:hypothetical protein
MVTLHQQSLSNGREESGFLAANHIEVLYAYRSGGVCQHNGNVFFFAIKHNGNVMLYVA